MSRSTTTLRMRTIRAEPPSNCHLGDGRSLASGVSLHHVICTGLGYLGAHRSINSAVAAPGLHAELLDRAGDAMSVDQAMH